MALGGIVSAILVLSVAYYWPIQESYHPLNPDWNGCSSIATLDRNITLVFSYDNPPQAGSPLLVIIGPSKEFSTHDAFYVRELLRKNGTVLLADDFGTGNSLLEKLNVSARFSGKPIADLYYYSKQPRFPIIVNFQQNPVTINVTAIVMNRPSFINVGNSSDAIELASSSQFSFIDLTPQDRPLPNETIASYPVFVGIKMDGGLLLLISDPDVFVNQMVNLYDNALLFRNILNVAGGRLFFDVAHLANAPLTNGRIMLAEAVNSAIHASRERWYVPFIATMVVVFGISLRWVRASKRQSQTK